MLLAFPARLAALPLAAAAARGRWAVIAVTSAARALVWSALPLTSADCGAGSATLHTAAFARGAMGAGPRRGWQAARESIIWGRPRRDAPSLGNTLVSVGVAMSRNFLLVCRVFIVIDQASRYNYKDEVCVGTGSAGH